MKKSLRSAVCATLCIALIGSHVGVANSAGNIDKGVDANIVPIDRAVDEAFIRWSTQWAFDRYVPGTAHASEQELRDGTYVVRGVFKFMRFGAVQTIPFASALTKTNDAFRIANLCYNDTTSGTTDCANASGISSQLASRQMLGAVVALGLLVAVASLSDSHDVDSGQARDQRQREADRANAQWERDWQERYKRDEENAKIESERLNREQERNNAPYSY